MANLSSWYVAMHMDRLSDELLSGTYGKWGPRNKKKQQKITVNKR